MTATILFVGDVHLGRRPARLPDALREWELTPRDLGPAAAWRNVVAWAIEHRPAAVVLAGDVVESENARFEAWGHLRTGVTELCDAGIDVVAVAGNHDVDTLPRLAELIDGFHLLGSGGEWETRDVVANGTATARLLGWSFPRRHVQKSPLAELRIAHDHSVPLLGVLHCDLDSRASPYAPVERVELEGTPVSGWFLGHIHRPSLAGGDRPLGYLGSLVGLDMKETGPHGPWRVQIGAGADLRCEQLSTSPLRWERVDVAADGVAATDLDRLLLRAVEDLHAALDCEDPGGLRAVGCRVRLTGSTTCWRELEHAVRALPAELPVVRLGDIVYFVVEVRNAARPDRDLVTLAAGNDPPGLLARELLALEQGGQEAAERIAAARNTLIDAGGTRAFQSLGEAPPSVDETRALLLAAGREALEELLAQRAGGGACA